VVPFRGLDLTAPEVDLHLLDHVEAGTVLHRGLGRRPVKLSWSLEFQRLVVWTLQGKDFVCVEPWTASAGALATSEKLLYVAPGQRFSLIFEIEA
jgi:galactose mutarotase-like enzyme